MEALGKYYTVLLSENLELILSFLSLSSTKSARLVCKQWNTLILTNFHKRWKITLKKTEPGEIVPCTSFLEKLDNRILKSVTISLKIENGAVNPVSSHFVFKELLFQKGFGMLRNLRLLEPDEKLFDIFLQTINIGGFHCLVELHILAALNQGLGENAAANCVASNALPRLRKLGVFRHGWVSSHLSAVAQSLLNAAPCLEILRTDQFIDLSQSHVQKLSLLINHHAGDDARSVLSSARLSISCLEVLYNYPSFPIPSLKNVKKLTMSYPCLRLEGFSNLLAAATGKLEEIQILRIMVPCHSYMPHTLQRIRPVLSAKYVPRIKLNFMCGEFNIRKILRFLHLLMLKEELKISEFYYVHWRTKNATLCRIHCASSSLEDYGSNWLKMEVKDFQLYVRLNPGDGYLPLFAEPKTGKVKISSDFKEKLSVSFEFSK